ncbi:efflux pump antibiotic resistance protein [Rutstroemia sp. NJR-2017a BVV2]|nr:efflux pump antibiotic resistance protein [Rutstroemia sp. NJR-2017a BVV2]
MTTTSKSENHDGLKIINAGLFRTATKSMARSYQILGFKTHHGLIEDVLLSPWTGIEQAAEATWPAVRSWGSPENPPFERSDWDALWGDKYDAVTDLASPFAPQLIRAYPNAKVVIVQRDFDSWWASFKPELLDRVMPQPMATISGWICWYVMGIRAVHAMRKVHFGFFNAKTPEEIELHARDAYEGYYREIRKMVPEQRKLEYKMGDGWEPLCEFLGVDVPLGIPFPRENDRASHSEEAGKRTRRMLMGLVKVAVPFVVCLAAVVGGWTYLK